MTPQEPDLAGEQLDDPDAPGIAAAKPLDAPNRDIPEPNEPA